MGTQLSVALRSASWLAPAAIIALAIIVVTLALIGLPAEDIGSWRWDSVRAA